MKSIIRAGIALGADNPLKKVYVGVNEGKIEVVSNEELAGYEDAELDIGGWDRLLSPGFISIHTFITLYPFRFRIFYGKINANDLLSVMSNNDVYHLALLGAYHLLRSGVTTVVFSDKYPDPVARAVTNVGLRPIIAIPVGCNNSPDDWEKEFKAMYNRWSHSGSNNVILKLCDQSLSKEVFDVAKSTNIVVLVERTVNLSSFRKDELPENIIALGGGSRSDLDYIKKYKIYLSFTPSLEISRFPLSEYKPSLALDLVPSFDIRQEIALASTRLMLTPEEAFRSITIWGHQQLGLNAGYLGINSDADLIIYEYREPPAFPLDYNSPYESLIYSGYNIETVFVGGESVLDGGVPLNVGLKDVEEGLRRVEEIDKRLGERIRSLEKSRDNR
ncbi:amidohydrolase family protein [Sulfurisphaera ohwakuensis]|uniref:Amidohydrolase family protein n=1 Tax=Sulfurisphaera ohwakuensis TaxID=69656 RepID=A0A650CEM0_SULOH|nr:amidohydrolase family protein [Sulfurisphaera ohwakuensis]MBB5252842.1 cytosine/adenosine deaminase-related metal-dependent hydrolase [Sulfurisphaera ohwakuensis]QGR16222.1 amidohydrolase family protein [Sulfurisphaera ohwakuensis]